MRLADKQLVGRRWLVRPGTLSDADLHTHIRSDVTSFAYWADADWLSARYNSQRRWGSDTPLSQNEEAKKKEVDFSYNVYIKRKMFKEWEYHSYCIYITFNLPTEFMLFLRQIR